MIVKFQPNIPVQLTLTRDSSQKSESNYGDGVVQWQWKGRQGDNFVVFYASTTLDQKIKEALRDKKIEVGEPCEICKRVNGKQTVWVVQAMPAAAGHVVEADEAHNTQSLPAPARQATVKPMATAPPAEKNTATPAAPTVREVARLYAECWLEVQHAMSALGAKGLKEPEDLRHATASVFIEATRRQIKPDVARLRELILITKAA